MGRASRLQHRCGRVPQLEQRGFTLPSQISCSLQLGRTESLSLLSPLLPPSATVAQQVMTGTRVGGQFLPPEVPVIQS